MKLALIAPALPPRLDGIGDYTANLAAALASSCDVTIITERGLAYDAISNVRVEQRFSYADPKSMWNIASSVNAWSPDWVVLQYNPYSYGRWGLNLQLPRVMRSLQCKPSTKFALMVHEPFVPVLDFKHAVMTTWQRWQLSQLGHCADRVIFSIEPWANKFSTWFPKHPVECLAVGSNIPHVLTERSAIRAELGISDDTTVLGFFGSAHNSRLLTWVREAAENMVRSGKKVLVLYVGPNIREMQEVLSELPLLATGALSGHEVSRHFAAMDIHLSPFVDGISTRRGSFVAGIQHGIPTVGTFGYNTSDSLLAHNDRAFLLTDAHSPAKFCSKVLDLSSDAEMRHRLSVEARRLFDEEFAWNKIALGLRSILAKSGEGI